MATRIRLSRFGRKKIPFYRIVVQDAKTKRDGKCIDLIGNYDPKTKIININNDKAQSWIQKGAQLTETVKSLFIKKEIIKK